MKTLRIAALFGAAAIISGCATNKSVQEAIDANHQDFMAKIESHEASIDVLKKSAMAGLEKSKANAELLKAQQAQLDKIIAQLNVVQGFAESAKVMSAANTVKVAELDDALETNTATDAETKQILSTMDKLYEEVMITHYQMIADSATGAIEQLKASGWEASTNAPVDLDEPIEIVAPDTSAPAATNTMAEKTPAAE